jgi:hypothetical protein
MGFISLYTLAFMSTSLVFLAPLLVTLALKVNSLVGIEWAPNSLAVVTGIGALLAMLAPEFVWELSLGIYLMVKGFKSSPITAIGGGRPDLDDRTRIGDATGNREEQA